MQSPKYRWFVVAIFFIFMLLHQSDKLLIGPLTTSIMDTFQITKTQMGAVFTGALVVMTLFYPLWGYCYDRFSRAKLISLASFIWGATTWFSAIAPTFPTFIISRASTGIDDSSYPGIYSMISDLFGPHMRGKIYGILQLAQPIGYLIGMILALTLGGVLGWRNIFYITGSLGIFLAIVIFLGIKDAPRGKSEPELADLPEMGNYKFDWATARGLFHKRSLLFMFAQGFFGVFPWNVITYWFFAYLETERNYSQTEILITMVIAVLMLAAGYPIGGSIGDYLFKKTPRGRMIISIIGVIMGAIFLLITLNTPVESKLFFGLMLTLTALFMPFSSPNVISTVYDITLPEVRSSAFSIQMFIESGGAALAPLLAGIIADNSTLRDAILYISVSAWAICAVFYTMAAIIVPKDIKILRDQLHERAGLEQQRHTSQNIA